MSGEPHLSMHRLIEWFGDVTNPDANPWRVWRQKEQGGTWAQRVLADHLGTTQRTILRWIKEDRIPGYQRRQGNNRRNALWVAEDIAEHFGVTPVEIWGDEWLEAVLASSDSGPDDDDELELVPVPEANGRFCGRPAMFAVGDTKMLDEVW